MANVTTGHNSPTGFATGETVTAAKLNNHVNSATITNIVNADIDNAAAIAFSKLATGALPAAITVASANIVDGTIVTADIADSAVTSAKIADGTIVNSDISASAAIADTKLATISTAGKVSNSATTATNANTANAIVARDASGNFSANTISANLTGNVTGNLTGTSSLATNLVGGNTGAVPYQTEASATGLLAPGTAGQVFTSNGTGQAPSWQASANLNTNANNLTGGSAGTIPYQSAAGTTTMLAAGTSGKVLTSNGAASPSWETPGYVTALLVLTIPQRIQATYTSVSTTVTITASNHGLNTNNVVFLNFTTGLHNNSLSGFEGMGFTVTKIDDNSFTIQKGNPGTTSGTVFIVKQPTITKSRNISSVTYTSVNNDDEIQAVITFSSGTFESAEYFVSSTIQTVSGQLGVRSNNQSSSSCTMSIDGPFAKTALSAARASMIFVG